MPKKPNQPTPQERRRSRKAFRQAMTKELREHRSSFLVFSVLRVLILVALVRQLMRGSYESAFFCVLALVLLYLPSWLQVKLRVELPRPWRSPFSASSSPRRFWGRSTPSMWWSPTGTPCSTPSTVFWPRRWGCPW